MFIKDCGDRIILAGMVATEEMISEGYVEYVGEVPIINKFQFLKMENGVLTVQQNIQYFLDNIGEDLKIFLNQKAKELQYDDINSISKFVGYDNSFRTECEKLGKWAADCWSALILIEEDVKNSVITIPSVDEILAQMPEFI